MFAALNSLAIDAALRALPAPYLPWMIAETSSLPLVCMWDACLAVVIHASGTSDVCDTSSKHMPLYTRALCACVDAVIALGAGLSGSAGAETGVKRGGLWQMEACVHILSGVPGVISAATASGDVDDDKLIAACRVMEEWMCNDATCAALMWLLALPSAGAHSPQTGLRAIMQTTFACLLCWSRSGLSRALGSMAGDSISV